MEFKRLKRSYSSDTTARASTTNLLSINTDCMFYMFDFLSIENLCSLGQTCAHLKNICGEYVSWKYPNKSIVINRNLKLVAKFKDETVNCFQNYIKNMDICRYANDGVNYDFWSNFRLNNLYPDDKDLLDMIPIYSGDSLKNITFKDVIFHNTFAAEMKNVLENIESLTFLSCYGKENFFVKILKHCQSLTSLIIHSRDKGILLNHLLAAANFPMMKNIEFRYVKASETFTEKLKDFFLVHTIVTFTWHFIFGPSISDKTFVKMIMQSAIYLEQLYLAFDRYTDLSFICEELTVLCDRENFKRLEMKFNADKAKNILIKNSDHLASLDVLKGLHFDFAVDCNIFAGIITPLESLQTLQIRSVPNGRKWQSISFEKLVNLEELIIKKLECLTFLEQFSRYAPKLKKVMIASVANFNIFGMKANQLLNEERGKLEGACTMTIYLKDENNVSMHCESDPYINPHNLVKVKYSKFHYDFKLKPFIKWEIDRF